MSDEKQALEQIIGTYASAAGLIATALEHTEFQIADADARKALMEDKALRESICTSLKEAEKFMNDAITIFEACIGLVQENQRLRAETETRS